MKTFETFRTEEELLRRIDELRADGIKDNELEIISSNEIEGYDELMYEDINHETGEASLGDKIAGFFTGEDPELRAFERLGFDERTTEQVLEAVNDNCYVLHIKREGFYDSNRDVEVGGVLSDERGSLEKDLIVEEGLLNDRDVLKEDELTRRNEELNRRNEDETLADKGRELKEDIKDKAEDFADGFNRKKEEVKDYYYDKKDNFEDTLQEKKEDFLNKKDEVKEDAKDYLRNKRSQVDDDINNPLK